LYVSVFFLPWKIGQSSEIDELLHHVHAEDDKISSKRYLTENQLLSAFSKSCSSIADLSSVAKALDLSTFTPSASFKETYRHLAKCIFTEYNLSFAIVEGLHRLYTVRNILEGRFCEQSEEPFAKNVFLQAKVRLRLHIVDSIETDAIQKFQELSLFIMKVKQSSLERTLFDEILQISNLMSGILDLKKTKFLEQPGRHDSVTGNYLFEQRAYVYKTILDFALNGKKSSVLYKMQMDHISSVISRQLIQNKHTFLGLDDSVDLKNEDLFQAVRTVVEKNMKEKACDYIMLCTKDSMRNVDNLTKPLSQDIRILMSYFTLASVNIETINRAVRIFSPSMMYRYEQSNTVVDIMHTMFRLVVTVNSIIDIFKKSVGLSAVEIYSSKVTQLLCMTLFEDVMRCIEDIGHNPMLPERYMDIISETEESSSCETIFLLLLKTWHDTCTADIVTRCNDTKGKWRNDLLVVAKGSILSKTDIRLGKFSGAYDQYCIPKELLFSSYFLHIGEETVNSTNTEIPSRHVEPIPDESVNTIPNETVNIPDETVNRNLNETYIDDSSREDKLVDPGDDEVVLVDTEKKKHDATDSLYISPRKRKVVLFDDEHEKSRKQEEVEMKQKSHKITKKDLKVTDEVFAIYKTVQSKSCENLPVDYEISAIKNAWIATANEIKSTEDLLNIWSIHKRFLFQYYATTSVMNDESTMREISRDK